jgi:hypothetical protein
VSLRLFKIASIFLWIVTTAGFTALAILYLLMSLLDSDVARRGGLLLTLVPISLACASFFIFRSMVRWANRQ